jgi:hypothetical protein
VRWMVALDRVGRTLLPALIFALLLVALLLVALLLAHFPALLRERGRACHEGDNDDR